MRHLLWLVGACVVTVSLSAYTWTAMWPGGTAAFYINPSNADNGLQAGRTDADVVAAVQAAMAVWNHASAFSFTYAGAATDTTTGNDGRNVILFRDEGADTSAVARTIGWWNTSTLAFLDTDIIFADGWVSFYTDATLCGSTVANPTVQTIGNAAYIQDVAAHELGHALGLNHSAVTEATMYPGYGYCSTTQRTLDADDMAGALFLYPTSAPLPPPPSGPTLTATGSKVKGVQSVDLRWSGLTAASVTVSRNGAVVKTTANDGAETDALNKKGSGGYTYQVCDTVCTNTAAVSF